MEIARDLQQITITPTLVIETWRSYFFPRPKFSHAAREPLRMPRRTIASRIVASTSQPGASETGSTRTGKVPPRVIEGRSEDGRSSRVLAVWATTATSVAALCALAALSVDAVRSTAGAPPGSGVIAAGVLAVAPLVVVAVLAIVVFALRPALAGALTAGYGAVSVGLLVLDLGLVNSPIDANRLELFRPTTAESLQAGLGTYLLIAAHALAVVGGLFGLLAINRASFDDGYGHSTRADLTGRASAARIGGLAALVAAVAAVVGAASMFAAPYDSIDSIVLVPAVVDAPLTTAIGSAVVALAVLVVVAAALASISPTVAAGATLGAGLGLLGLSGSRVIAGVGSGPTIDPSVGAWIGAAAAIVLVAVGLLVIPLSALRDRRSGAARIERADLAKSGGAAMRWHVAAGSAGVLAGVLLCAGGLLPVLEVPDGLPNLTILATRIAVIAGFLLVVVSVPLFFSLFASVVRPATGVLAVAAVMAAAGVLQSVVLATDIDGIALGTGGVATLLAVLAALACGAAVLLAGSAERDDVDTSDSDFDGRIASVAVLGAIVSAVGLALPLYRGADVTAPALLELPWGWDGWGQALLAVALVGSAVVAARSRPQRGTALLAGGVVAMVVYLLGWPLTQGRALDPVVGAGALFGVLGAVILAVAAVLSARRPRQ